MKFVFVLALITVSSADVFYHLDSEAQNSRDFTGKVALVTGSNSGIGEGIVKLLASLGAQVVVTGRNATTVREVAEEVKQLSPNKLEPLQVVGDVSKDSDLEKLVDETIKKFGRLDIVVNNAGIAPLTNIDDNNFVKTFDFTLAINLRAPAVLNHLAVPHLKQTNGTIIQISSVASLIPIWDSYSVSKLGLDMMTRCLALELGPHGIRVNTINPGYIKTPLSNQDFPDEIKKELVEHTPLRRAGETDDIAKAVAFLASSDASFITGANLVVDGGSMYTAGGILGPN